MNIGSLSEDKTVEKRVSITPEIAKKYIQLGIDVQITNNYGDHIGFKDSDYTDQGVKLVEDNKKLIESSDVIIQMGLTNDENLSLLKPNQTYIGVLNSYENKQKLNELIKMSHYVDLKDGLEKFLDWAKENQVNNF